MTWLQLDVETHQEKAEPLSELLEQFGAVSVSFTAASDEPVFDAWGEEKKLWQRTNVSALLHPDCDLDIMLVCLRDRIGADNIFRHHISEIKDKDWVSEYKASHQSVIFANKICITPSWCDKPENNLPNLILDPGLAFGTGTHPTTSLCINWLADANLKNKIVIDYGCGSGILAMVAAMLGAEKVYAVDIDKQAVAAAEQNVKNNNLSDSVILGHVDEVTLPIADVLVANILMNPLKELKLIFSEHIKTGGDLVLSGLLHIQAEECLEAYADCFTMSAPVFESEWTRLNGIKI